MSQAVVLPQVSDEVETTQPFACTVWNDPVNLMSYVTYVFMTYFNYAKPKAEELMLQVHHNGKAYVSYGDKEKIEKDVAAMHSYGLWATIEKAS